MFSRGRLAVLYVLGSACGVLLIISAIRRGSWSDAVTGVVILVAVLALSPIGIHTILRAFPRRVDTEAIASAPVVVYWRPMSTECLDLRMHLGREAKNVLWVNIWRDEAAAETVRTINDGTERVPTMIIGNDAYSRPDVAMIRRALRARRTRTIRLADGAASGTTSGSSSSPTPAPPPTDG